MHISLSAEPVFRVGGFVVTNSLIASLMTSMVLIVFALFMSTAIKSRQTRFLAMVEEIFIFMLDLAESVGGKYAKRFLPLVLTLFLFILVSNWLGLMPGFGSVIIEKVDHGHYEAIPLLKGATADLNTTLALALVSVFAIQYYGVEKLKLSYFKKFIDLSSPIKFFVGFLESISEFAKIISFSFRLFGNIFAGEVLLAVVISLVPYIAPLPFLGLEIFVGFIQALVFALLTLVFAHMATVGHGDDRENDHLIRKEVGYGI